MSTATLKIINPNGDVVDYKEYKNAWGFQPYVWDAIYDKYFKDPTYPYDSWMSLINRDNPERTKKFWHMVYDKNFPIWTRRVVAWTYDNAILEADQVEIMSDYLKEFKKTYDMKERICHLLNIADDITNYKDECFGFCWHGTSVCEDPWIVYSNVKDDEEDQQDRPYNINKDKKHWFIFKEII